MIFQLFRGLGLLALTPLSAIFRLYRGSQLYWCNVLQTEFLFQCLLHNTGESLS